MRASLKDQIYQGLVALEDRLKGLEQTVERVESGVDELLLSPQERQDLLDKRRFNSAATITLKDVQEWKQGDTMDLIEESVIYPPGVLLYGEWMYRYDHIFGHRVHGFIWEKSSKDGEEEWLPHDFLASADRSSTSSCDGTVRRLPTD